MGKLTEYKNSWKNMFLNEKEILSNALKDLSLVEIEHIGATSIEGCNTYGTIDILVSVHNIYDLIVAKNILARNGYECVSHLSNDFKDIYLIKRNEKKQIIRATHIVEHASIIHQEYLLFKYHISEGNNALKYNDFREALLDKCNGDIKEYKKGKSEYIRYCLDTFCKTSEVKK